jgi:hypothetical protein
VDRIALIACSKSKLNTDGRVKATELYTGNLFKAQLAYARQVLKLPDEQIYILSAGYGLVRAYQFIETYDVTLSAMTAVERQEWLERVTLRLLVPLLAYHPAVVIMAGKLYREPLINWLETWSKKMNREPAEIILPPPPGLGYGRQVAWYQAEVGK